MTPEEFETKLFELVTEAEESLTVDDIITALEIVAMATEEDKDA